MNLTLDFGNTRTKIGVFENGSLIHHELYERIGLDVLDKLIEEWKVERAAICSVIKIPDEIDQLLSKRCSLYLYLDEHTPLPIENRYQTPETLGKDRIAAVVGAMHLFPHENCFIIDAGTCITTDVLTQEGIYLGGNISPGINMRLRAMHEFTANLPLVERIDYPEAWGINTKTALINGGQLGAILEISGMIGLMEEKFGRLRVLATGGDAKYLAKSLKTEIFVSPFLVLTGLDKILNYNVEYST